MRVRVRGDGLRAVHAAGFAFRSEQEKKISLLQAAFIAPPSFRNGVIRAHVFPLRPATENSWECLLAVDFPVSFAQEAAGTAKREFAVAITNGSSLIHRIDRKISLNYKNPRLTTRRVSFTDNVRLAPGKYTVTAVLGDESPGSSSPSAARAQIVVPPIPKGRIFLVDPILGKRANEDLVVHGSGIGSGKGKSSDEIAKGDRPGTPASFMPLLVQQFPGTDPAIALTQACLVKQHSGGGGEIVDRALEQEDGTSVGTMPGGELNLDPKGDLDCQAFADLLPVPSLRPGDYLFKALLRSPQHAEQAKKAPPVGTVRFAVLAPDPSSQSPSEDPDE